MSWLRFNKMYFKEYILEFILLAFLVFTLFVLDSNIIAVIIIAVALLIFSIISNFIFKSENKNYVNSKKAFAQLILFAFLNVVIQYFIGLSSGIGTTYYDINFALILENLIPLAVIIISTEKIRKNIVGKKDKISQILIFVITVLIDLVVYIKLYKITRRSNFEELLILAVFSEISLNLLFNYISKRFSEKSIIIYRLITLLYIYILPIVPSISDFVKTSINIIYSYLIYIIFENEFSEKKQIVSRKNKQKELLQYFIVIMVTTLLIMLISCKFHFGILAVGSESMKDFINKGDAVVFTKYRNQEILKGDVILFRKNGSIIIHRVDEVLKENNKQIYVTKGDNNEIQDSGTITKNEILGIYDFKLKYLGYPTVWINETFRK